MKCRLRLVQMKTQGSMGTKPLFVEYQFSWILLGFLNLNPSQNIYSLNRGIMILMSMNIKIIKSTNYRQPRIQAHSQYLFYNI